MSAETQQQTQAGAAACPGTASTATYLYEITIDELLAAYEQKRVSAVAVVARYLNRIGAYDRSGAALNSVIVLNPDVFAEAAESDRRWAEGTARPLEGVPFTVKDSYMVAGLTVASGSPAFAGLIAQWDAFSVAQLREAGAVLIGKTNMPPMADGGMQRGVYGRAENPYNPDYLAAAYASGSSNGSGVATAANFAVFGMGEETVSSGRSPASNNGLCAYTPSWGVISIRGNWPLFPARDVVVPHSRTMGDMLHILNALVADDSETRGDFWRHQQAVEIPPASQLRPADYRELAGPDALKGKVLGVPKMYLGEDDDYPLEVRDSIIERWEAARERLESLGATVVEVDFPLIKEYEGDNPGGENIDRLGVLPEGWMDTEFSHFLAHGWADFLAANGDPQLQDLAEVDPDTIFPLWPGTLPDRYEEVVNYENRYRSVVEYAQDGITDPRDRADFAPGLKALVQLREQLFENWLETEGLDAIVFPANADVGDGDADFDPDSNDYAWENGVFYSNGNYALRHLGIPTVTVPMGAMRDIGVPVGLTFAGRAYHDSDLLAYAAAYDRETVRPVPAFAPRQEADTLPQLATEAAGERTAEILEMVATSLSDGAIAITVCGAGQAENVQLAVNGVPLLAQASSETDETGAAYDWKAQGVLQIPDFGINPEQPLLVVATALIDGSVCGDFWEVPIFEDDDEDLGDWDDEDYDDWEDYDEDDFDEDDLDEPVNKK